MISRCRPRSAGFTLIELAVVMLLLVIVLAMAGLKLDRNDDDIVRQESQRLALLLQAAQQEAILQGQTLAVGVGAEGYIFGRLNDKNELQPLSAKDEDILRPRRLPEGMEIASVSIEGADAGREGAIILSPSGDLPPFRIVLAQGQARWHVDGGAGGDIKSLPAE
jgi:general secretion pathway protein H